MTTETLFLHISETYKRDLELSPSGVAVVEVKERAFSTLYLCLDSKAVI